MRNWNVSLRSNVMCGSVEDVAAVASVRHTVRGGIAIETLLRRMQVNASIGYLTPVQLAELSQQVPCSSCGARPVGPVLSNGTVVLELRCPLGTCTHSGSRARELSLDDAALEQLRGRAPDNDWSGLIDGLLRDGLGSGRRRALSGPVRSLTVRLSPSTFYLVSGLSTLELSQCAAGLLDS